MTRYFLLIFIALITCATLPATAQTKEYATIHKGIRAFRHDHMEKADKEFQKALKANSNSARALFAKGCVALKNHQDSTALKCLQDAADNESSKKVKAMSFHNIGSFHYDRAYSKYLKLDSIKSNSWDAVYAEAVDTCTLAIEAYKKALRNDPANEDSRYNLALAQHLLKKLDEMKPEDNNKDQDQKDEDQNESNDGQNKQDDDDQNDDQDNGGGNNQQQDDQNKQSQESDEENYEQLLELSRQAEEQARQRIQAAQQKSSRRLKKNW